MSLASLALVFFLAQNNPSTASVEGIVAKMGSQEPLAGARVELHPERVERLGGDRSPEPIISSAVTSSDGKFTLASVPPGTYRLTATRTNYVPAEYGQRSPTSQGIPLTLTSGQRLTNIQLAMPPAGSIAGRIFDKDGEPVGRAQVQALRSIYKDGSHVLTIVQSVETNDRGEYRLFWLAPGTYYVSAKPDIPQLPVNILSLDGAGTVSAVRVTEPARFGSYAQASGAVVKKRITKNGEVIEEVSIPVYYPGVVEATGATPIPLAAGANVNGVDISIGSGVVPARHIRGRVIDGTTGQPMERAEVSAVPRSRDPLVIIPSGQTDPNGNFDMPGVAPGAYFLVVATPKLSSITPVEVGNSNLQNIPLVALPPVKLAGRFVIEGSRSGSELRMQDLRVDRLTRDPDLVGIQMGGPSFNPPPAADGSFALDGVSPGDYRVSVRTGTRDAYVKSIRMGNSDVLDGGLHFSGPPDAPLEIVVSAGGGRISGRVVNARGESVSNRTVVLVPDARFRHRTDLYKSVATDSAGAFRLQGIPPGDYELFSWENVETGAWQDSDFIRGYQGRGKKVLINENSDENLELSVIP